MLPYLILFEEDLFKHWRDLWPKLSLQNKSFKRINISLCFNSNSLATLGDSLAATMTAILKIDL